MKRYARNLCISAIISMTMVIVFSVGFAFLTGNIGTADHTPGFSTTSFHDRKNTTSVAVPEPTNDITDKKDPPKPESILQTVQLPQSQGTPEIHKADHIPESQPPIEPMPDKPHYASALSGTVSKITKDFVINGQIRLSLVQSGGTDAEYSGLHQACPVGTHFVYHQDTGLAATDGTIYAKVWCLYGNPDQDEPFETWHAPGGAMSVNEWLLHKNRATLDSPSCSRSSFGGERWASTLGCN